VEGETQRDKPDQPEESDMRGDRTRLLVEDNEETSDLTTENIVISNPIENMSNNNASSPGNRVSDSCDTIIADVTSVNPSLDGESRVEVEEVELKRLHPDTKVKRQSKLGSLWMSVKKWAKTFIKDMAFLMW